MPASFYHVACGNSLISATADEIRTVELAEAGQRGGATSLKSVTALGSEPGSLVSALTPASLPEHRALALSRTAS